MEKLANQKEREAGREQDKNVAVGLIIKEQYTMQP